MNIDQLVIKPVTIAEWPDMQVLFTTTPSWGCWCMYWRGSRTEFKQGRTADHKAAMENVIRSGTVPGLLAYREGKPIGWVSVGPREDFIALEKSRMLKRIDDQPVWSIVCFLVSKSEREKGILYSLIKGAVQYAACNGAKIVEAYPLIPEESRRNNSSEYMGILSAYQKLGFQIVAQPSKMRVTVRLPIENPEEV